MRHACAAAFALAVIAAAACGKNDIGGIRPGTVFVAARDTFFTPETLTVALGNPVRWTNEGAILHTVASDSALWESDLLAPTWWFEVTFDSAGTFPYHCAIHSGMIGTIVVTP